MIVCLVCAKQIEFKEGYWQCDCTLVKAIDDQTYEASAEPAYWKPLDEVVTLAVAQLTAEIDNE